MISPKPRPLGFPSISLQQLFKPKCANPMVKKKDVRINKEVVAWANRYFCENKEILQVLDINSVQQLINRLLKIQPAQTARIVELKQEICDISSTV